MKLKVPGGGPYCDTTAIKQRYNQQNNTVDTPHNRSIQYRHRIYIYIYSRLGNIVEMTTGTQAQQHTSEGLMHASNADTYCLNVSKSTLKQKKKK